jgi:dsDNA-specific endonuclease/ATPase MutS2
MGRSPIEIRGLAAQLATDLPQLDLHKHRPDEIDSEIDQFLYHHAMQKNSAVEIIFGIGKGVLRNASLEFLHNHPLVEKVLDKGGSCVVLLVE